VANPCGQTGPARLNVRKLGVADRGRMVLRGELLPPGEPAPDIDPATSGVELTLHDASGPALDAVIPGGALWRVRGDGRKWIYRSLLQTPPGGINQIVINLDAKKPTFKIRGKNGTYAVSPDVVAELYFPGSDVCLGTRFPEGCVLSGSGENQKLKCK
jgi:hypothetical protein